MSDEELGKLQRRFEASGLDEDQAAWFRARLEAEDLDPLELRALALGGNRGARLALPQGQDLDRWDPFTALVEQWFAPVAARGGVSEAQIAAAEARLDIELPLVLWEFYRLYGRRLGPFSRFPVLKPSELAVREGRLVVAVENHGLQLCGVPLEQLEEDDPQVDQVWGYDHENSAVASGSLRDLLQLLVFRDTTLACSYHVAQRSGPLGRLSPGVHALDEGWLLEPNQLEQLDAEFAHPLADVSGFPWRVYTSDHLLIWCEDHHGQGGLAQATQLCASAIGDSPEAFNALTGWTGLTFDPDED